MNRLTVVGTVAALALGAAAGWGLHTVLAPAPEVTAAPEYAVVRAGHGEVGRTLALSASASWPTVGEVVTRSGGTVTTLSVADGAEISAGEPVLTIDLRPVVVAAGTVPTFRDMSLGTVGPDVQQLQQLLSEQGFGSKVRAGTFDAATLRAVRAWQKASGFPVDGTVRQGDVLFLPSLPVRAASADGARVGDVVGPGQPILRILDVAPRFELALQDGQTDLMAVGTEVRVHHGADVWPGVIGALRRDQSGTVATLVGPQGAAVCSADCAAVAVGDTTLLPTDVLVIKGGVGTTVPTAAIVTGVDGQTYVTLANGRRHPIEVLASASGMSLIKGIDEGSKVRTPVNAGTPAHATAVP